MTTVAEVLAQSIIAAGIDTVFGLPGGENAEVLDAIRRAGLEFVNPDYAQIAGAYALGYFRVDNDVACEEAVRTAVAAARPVLIEALIDPLGYPTTPKFS